VPARTGVLLHVLVRATGATRVLEIGTLGGYSAVWMGRALPPGGRILSLEREPEHAAVARESLRKAGLAGRVEVREGLAAELLPGLEDGAWDLVFIDADKEGYPLYLREAARLLRPGGLVVADNAFWRGQVLDDDPEEDSTRALQEFHRALADTPDFTATVLPVGDGVAVGVRS
jgi:predicted O-methyltransferase YrrM